MEMEPFITYNTLETIQSLPFFAHKKIHSVTPLLPREHGNAVMRVATTEGCYVVRQGTRRERDMGVEYRVGRLAYGAGIAPEIYCYDPMRSVMVLAYVEGGHRSRPGRDEWMQLARILHTLHAIPYQGKDLPQVNLRELIEVDHEAIAEAFATVEHFPLQPALCHHDLTPRNILWVGDAPMLIDFEFAGIGDRCFDLAAVCVEFGLEGEAEALFLAAYFEDPSISNATFFRRRDFGPADAGLQPRLRREGASDLAGEESPVCPQTKLAAWKVLYRALRRQWFARHGVERLDQIP